MIRDIKPKDIEMLRLYRNKWQPLGLFRQSKEITKQEQVEWFGTTENHGVIINEKAYGKIYDTGEVSFYGFDEWRIKDLKELVRHSTVPTLHGECYQHNQFLTMWLEAGFKVVGYKRFAKYWDNRMWDSLLLEYNQ